MAKVHFTKKAIEDLASIWNYTRDEWSERHADKYYSILFQACNEVARDSKKGKPYEEISEGVCGYLISRHIIFFKRIKASEILVIRFLHAQMDLKSKKLE